MRPLGTVANAGASASRGFHRYSVRAALATSCVAQRVAPPPELARPDLRICTCLIHAPANALSRTPLLHPELLGHRRTDPLTEASYSVQRGLQQRPGARAAQMGAPVPDFATNAGATGAVFREDVCCGFPLVVSGAFLGEATQTCGGGLAETDRPKEDLNPLLL